MLKYETHDNEIIAGFVADNEVDRKKKLDYQRAYMQVELNGGVYIFFKYLVEAE